MFRKLVFLLLILGFCSIARSSFAQGVDIISKAEVDIKVKNTDGTFETKRVPASQANVGPGDVVIFSNICVNKGEKPAEDIVITNPIPNHTIYVDGSAEGKDTIIEFSVDGGKTFGSPEKLIVFGEDGRPRKAKAEDYTHIRWKVTTPIPTAQSVVVSFKAKIK